jgi:hypothetical protein
MRPAHLTFLVGLACSRVDPNRLSPEQLAEVRRAVEGLEAEIASCALVFDKAAAIAAEGASAVKLSDSRCDAPLDAPAKGSNARKSLDAKYFKVWPVRRFRPGEKLPAPKACDVWGWPLQQARDALTTGTADASTLATVRSLLQNHIGSYEALVAVSDERAPVPRDGALPGLESFEPGSIKGRAYLYDLGERRLVCAGEVASSSSESVNVRFRYHDMNVLDAEMKQREATPGALAGDAEAQLRRAIASQLKKVNP